MATHHRVNGVEPPVPPFATLPPLTSDRLDEAAPGIKEAWLHHPVLVFHGCDLTPEDLVRFGAIFGTPVPVPVQEDVVDTTGLPPEIMIISNIVENGRRVGHLGGGDLSWHTDMCYVPEPALASALYAVETPEAAGDTWFLDMTAVHDSLPVALRERIAPLSCKHDDSRTAAGDLRHGRTPVHDVTTSSGAVHPLVRIRPETGRKALYLGRRLHAYIPGLSLAESDALLDDLWRYCEDPAPSWPHRWSPGDLVVWDNRVMMHRRDAIPDGARRLMHRIQAR
ncbi:MULTISPECIES: TauD/TfdA dioxygenase family protein [Streptomyces]|uniref:TauD/TfdA family dioxygenase n=1 Tax=Streptomyces doudnae TaxID=3075536 RepID=A0ABD5EJ30_9ACTN|nr:MULTISPECIES: TauD/TfdA family dioxygenase [unclassified Streptomyces]MDT0433417.1 TauD/TfdA family dioxygenase [Streptomyces sp. DSM 41981]MYQ66818.1 TauD/TfdA family dioxygenase [Streptomyces sp. SID4950]SCE25770.1 taurine dioxygenase [Streptomyces sp. SolWspMP-5a-2]